MKENNTLLKKKSSRQKTISREWFSVLVTLYWFDNQVSHSMLHLFNEFRSQREWNGVHCHQKEKYILQVKTIMQCLVFTLKEENGCDDTFSSLFSLSPSVRHTFENDARLNAWIFY